MSIYVKEVLDITDFPVIHLSNLEVLNNWAKEKDFEEVNQAVIVLFGLRYFDIGIDFLVEITSQFIGLNSFFYNDEWSDCIEATTLFNYFKEFSESDIYLNSLGILDKIYTVDSIKRIQGYVLHTYLSAMLVMKLSEHDDFYLQRKKLRIWLVVHGFIRIVRNRYHGDTKISALARYLILDHGKINEWNLIDTLLSFVSESHARLSFESFNCELVKSAEATLVADPAINFSSKKFLNNLITVGNYSCNASNCSDLRIYQSFLFQGFSLRNNEFTEYLQFTEDDGDDSEQAIAGFNLVPTSNAISQLFDSDEAEALFDDQEPELLIEVDPKLNEAEQLVSSRSVFLHTAEEASYLPWSLHQILPPEKSRFIAWLNLTLYSEVLSESLGAAFCLLALQTGRTLFGVKHFKITEMPDFEWSICDDFSKLQRKVVRRHDHWQPNKNTDNLVEKFADRFSLELNKKLAETLSYSSKNLSFKAQSLHDLWRINVHDVELEVWLNNALPEDLKRITSGKLGSFLGQQVFENTGDFNLTRNLTAHPNSGLPAAVGYGTWDLETIEKGIEQPLLVESSVSPKTHLLGSLLSPLEGLLVERVNQANTLLEKEGYGLVEFHNLICQYTVFALYAATGARNLIDPFENFIHFDLDGEFVILTDKAVGGVNRARLVPLPILAVSIVKQYLKHLVHLSDCLESEHPALAESLNRIAAGSSDVMPFFFLLDEGLSWHSFNKDDLPGVPLFDWGLPRNLFRHRYNQQLYKENVPVEVIDGFMGHAERGASTYGDTSPRSWLDDARTYLPIINKIFEALPFKVLELNNHSLPLPDTVGADLSFKKRLFGLALRKSRRSTFLKKNISEAKNDINSSLRGRALIALTAAEVQQLVDYMLYRGGKLLHHFAASRLEILRKQIHRDAPEHKHVINRRFLKAGGDHSTLSEAAVSDYKRFKALKEWSSTLAIGCSHYLKSTASLLGVSLLAIEKRIAYPKMLIDILEGNNFRIIKDKRQLFIEYSEALEVDDPYASVQRHEINQQIASLITFGAGKKKKPQATNTKEIEVLRSILQLDEAASHFEIVNKLAGMIEQVNHVDLPGILGAMLAGRVLSSSLPMLDHIRVKDNKSLIWESIKQFNTFNQQDNVESALKGRRETEDTNLLISNAAIFRKAILYELNMYKPSQAKITANSLKKICLEHEGLVSNALLLVGFWIVHITERGRADRKSKPLAASSLKTYFSTLFTVFEKLAYKVNLITLESEDVTALYSGMLDSKKLQSKTYEYFGNRLVEFHRWAKDFGVVDPDWSELDFKEDGRLVRPGILSEKDYQSSLAYINAAYDDADTRLLMSFLLLLTYRYGLRSREASGLLSKDWCQYQELTWVLIRNNKLRNLKTHGSQRAVPLLFNFSSLEEKIVERVFTRYQALIGNEKKHPLFCEIVNSKIVNHTNVDIFPGEIIKVIRAVTGSTDLVLHDGRHTFYNRVAAALFEIDTPLTRELNKGVDTAAIQKIVLGNNHGVSRRSSMALARLMGHSVVTTGMRSYNHLLSEWADNLTPVSSKRVEILKCIDTKNFIKYEAPKPVKTELKYQPATLETIFKTLRLVAIGWSFEKAGLQLELDPVVVIKLKNTFWEANNKMEFNSIGTKGKAYGRDIPNLLLKRITTGAWQRILSIAAKTPETFSVSQSHLPALNKLQSMVGGNRQVLLDDQESTNLAKLTLELFLVDAKNYSICAKGNDPEVNDFLVEQGLNVVPVERATSKGTPLEVDRFEVFENGRLISTHYEYGILNLFRNKGALRCSNDLAVAILGLGVFAECM